VSCFPYEDDSPVVTMTLINPKDESKFIVVEAFFDTGADVSLAPYSVSEALGLDLSLGEKVTIGGVGGGTLTAYIHDVKVELGSISMVVPIAIAEDDSVPMLLGRYGFFDKIGMITLDNMNYSLCFYEEAPLPLQIPAKFPIIWSIYEKICYLREKR